MNNTTLLYRLGLVGDCVATISDIYFWNDDGQNSNAAILVGEDSSLLASNILVDYQSFTGITIGKNTTLTIKDSLVQSINNPVDNDGAVISLKNVSVSDVFCGGESLLCADGLVLQADGRYKYIQFHPQDVSSDDIKALSKKHWMMGVTKGQVILKNVELPKNLPSKLAPALVIGNAKVDIDLANQKQLQYQPWIETMEEPQVSCKDAQIEDVSTTDVKDHPLGSSTVNNDGRDPLEELDEMIGLDNVKKQVTDFISMAAYKKWRKDEGVKISNSLHSIFEGNPGTGKTTVARLVGKIAYQKGILPSNKYVEVDRSGLMAEYTGQTGPKTLKVLKKATGGVLFIDEAYSLVSNARDSFGKEALDTILKYMEDHRDKLMIIFAGYTQDMHKLLEYNQGMKSRIPNIFTFEDYTPAEAVKIGLLQLKKSMKMQFDSPATEQAYAQLVSQKYEAESEHSNARWVRNLNDKLINAVAVRTGENTDQPDDVIMRADLDAFAPHSGSDTDSLIDEYYS